MALTLTSSAFKDSEPIPSRYTCDGDNLVPPLSVSGVPGATVSLVLFMDDPDAPVGTWDHWVVFNISPSSRTTTPGTFTIQEGKEPEGTRGANSWDRLGYGGPCPHDGEHRYIFRVFALNTTLDIPEGASKKKVAHTMEGHILEEAVLTGRYKRS